MLLDLRVRAEDRDDPAGRCGGHVGVGAGDCGPGLADHCHHVSCSPVNSAIAVTAWQPQYSHMQYSPVRPRPRRVGAGGDGAADDGNGQQQRGSGDDGERGQAERRSEPYCPYR